MRPEQRDAACLWDMLDSAARILEYTDGLSFDQFMLDIQLRDAVERRILLIGEAANRVSKEFRASHPQIPWPKIIAQRNIVVHEYDHIVYEVIWDVVTQHIPKLIEQLESLLPPSPPPFDL